MSGETKYTPGPWRVPQPWSGFSEIRGANDELVFGLAAGCEGEKQPDETCEANARLISAAPDLVEALKWFIDDIDGTHTVMLDFDANVARARAALSKALGEGQEDNV